MCYLSPKGYHVIMETWHQRCKCRDICYLISRRHYGDVIMTTIASQITSLSVVYSIVYSDADHRKHQSSASLAFVWGIHRDRWIPRTKVQLRGKCFHLMTSSWITITVRYCHNPVWYHAILQPSLTVLVTRFCGWYWHHTKICLYIKLKSKITYKRYLNLGRPVSPCVAITY